jgi:hypothetical protein
MKKATAAKVPKAIALPVGYVDIRGGIVELPSSAQRDKLPPVMLIL